MSLQTSQLAPFPEQGLPNPVDGLCGQRAQSQICISGSFDDLVIFNPKYPYLRHSSNFHLPRPSSEDVPFVSSPLHEGV